MNDLPQQQDNGPIGSEARVARPAGDLAYAPRMARPARAAARYPQLDVSRVEALVDLLVAGLAIFAFINVLGMAGVLSWLVEQAGSLEMFVISVVLGVLSLSTVAVILQARHQPARSIGLNRTSMGRVIGGALLAVPSCYMLAFVSVMFYMQLMGVSEQALLAERTAFFETLPTPPMWVVVAFSLFVGVHEEVFFRGFVLTRLNAVLRSRWGAIVVSSIVFGLLHFDQGPIGVVQTATVGFVLAVAATYLRTIWPVIIAHAMFDTISLSLIPWLQEVMPEMERALTTTTQGA